MSTADTIAAAAAVADENLLSGQAAASGQQSSSSSSPQFQRRWVVFDGPGDPVWLDNLNTVLDDSKKLCLMNGEIIPLTKWMNIIFEMSDLRRVSPSVVGRRVLFRSHFERAVAT